MQTWAWAGTNWTNRKHNNCNPFHFLLSIFMQGISLGPWSKPRRLAAQVVFILLCKEEIEAKEDWGTSNKIVAKVELSFGNRVIPSVTEYGKELWMTEQKAQVVSSWRHRWRWLASPLEGYPFLNVLECCPESWMSPKPLEVWGAQRAGKTRQDSSQHGPPAPPGTLYLTAQRFWRLLKEA